jgi:hypothetical protein
MADDKSKTGGQDRARVAGGQDYEVQYLMQKTKVSAEQARDLIKRFGNDRDVLEREARKLDR